MLEFFFFDFWEDLHVKQHSLKLWNYCLNKLKLHLEFVYGISVHHLRLDIFTPGYHYVTPGYHYVTSGNFKAIYAWIMYAWSTHLRLDQAKGVKFAYFATFYAWFPCHSTPGLLIWWKENIRLVYAVSDAWFTCCYQADNFVQANLRKNLGGK